MLKKREDSKETIKRNEYLVRDLSDDPAFIKMADESLAFIKKHGFPKELVLENKTVREQEFLVPDLSNDPIINKRADESKEFPDRVGFPKELIDKK